MATCRDCKLFDLEAAKDKAGRVLSNRMAECNWVPKEKYPASTVHPFRPVIGSVRPTDGNGCPCFQKRVTK